MPIALSFVDREVRSPHPSMGKLLLDISVLLGFIVKLTAGDRAWGYVESIITSYIEIAHPHCGAHINLKAHITNVVKHPNLTYVRL